MKFLICLILFAIGASSFYVDESVEVPIYETEEWQELHPEFSGLSEQSNQERRSGRVWNGRPVGDGEIPYQVKVSVLLSRTAWCGGSIVSNNFVLTAAQCFPRDPPVEVSGGRADRLNPLFTIGVSTIIQHPAFNPDVFANDLALLRLVSPITTSSTVQIVRLPNRRQTGMEFLNQMASYSGWGPTHGGSEIVQFLTVGSSQVISQTACRIRFPTIVSANTLCYDGSATNSCANDFGGPVTIRDADGITTQIGIASFVSPLGCTFGFPGGFTRLTQYIEWIGANSDVVIRDGF